MLLQRIVTTERYIAALALGPVIVGIPLVLLQPLFASTCFITIVAFEGVGGRILPVLPQGFFATEGSATGDTVQSHRAWSLELNMGWQ